VSTRQAMCVWRNIEARSCIHCCHGKTISITYPECVSVALVIQHAMPMRRIILSSVSYPAVPYFSTLSHKRHDFRKKRLLNIKFVFWFSLHLSSQTLLILSRIQWSITTSVHRSSAKVPVTVLRFQRNLNLFSTDFRKILKYGIS
jgi:hypothetical protein